MLVPIYVDFDGKPVRLGEVRITGSSTARLSDQAAAAAETGHHKLLSRRWHLKA
jgi:hypothetical protein